MRRWREWSTAEAAEDSLWDDLAPDDPDETSPSTNMSENILGDAKEAVNTMDVDALSEAAEAFDKLAAHGKDSPCSTCRASRS